MRDQNIKITIGSEKSFGIVFSIIFMIIALYPLFINSSINLTFLTISIIFIILSFVFPSIFKYPNLIWFKFGRLLNEGTYTPVKLNFCAIFKLLEI